MIGLLPIVPALPLMAAVWCLAGGKWLPRGLPLRGGEWVVVATALALVALGLLHGQHGTLQATWFQSGSFELSAGLELNGLTWLAATLVAGVSLLVALYAVGYMREARDASRFFAELSLFIGAMLVLVLASSLVLLYAAWEVVGIASYLLIGFRREADEAAPAARRALLMTRLTDMAFLLGWLLVLTVLHTTDITTFLTAVGRGELSTHVLTALALLIFVGCLGKSAQLPFTTWLPDAMIAPTPVSALLHSATMVAAGVYLLVRLNPLFMAVPAARAALSWIGTVTAVFSALIALGETDLKRVLAWSTSSHLGAMLLAVGLAGPLGALAQLVTHALAKSTLFLAAGAVEQHSGTRDLRRLQGLGRAVPLTTLAFVLGALALTGFQPFPLLSSDELAIAAALRSGSAPAALVAGLVFLSGLYIARATVAVFAGGVPVRSVGGGERSPPMLIGMSTLAVAAVLGGLLFGAARGALSFGRAPQPPWAWRLIDIAAAVSGLALGAWHAERRSFEATAQQLSQCLQRGLTAITAYPASGILAVARGTIPIERGLDALAREAASLTGSLANGVDHLEQRGFAAGGDSIAGALRHAGQALRRLETGKLYWYLLGLFVGSILVMLAASVPRAG